MLEGCSSICSKGACKSIALVVGSDVVVVGVITTSSGSYGLGREGLDAMGGGMSMKVPLGCNVGVGLLSMASGFGADGRGEEGGGAGA